MENKVRPNVGVEQARTLEPRLCGGWETEWQDHELDLCCRVLEEFDWHARLSCRDQDCGKRRKGRGHCGGVAVS